MKVVQFIHVGDIHYPDFKAESLSDTRDSGMKGAWLEMIKPKPLQQVSTKLLELLDQDDIKAVLLSGDLTSKGQIEGYKACLDWLKELLDLNNTTRWKDKAIHVVPGNHDVVRSDVDPTGKDVFRKFGQLEAAWKSIGQPFLQASQVRRTHVVANNCRITFLSLNTCVGSGETRSLPDEVRAQLTALLAPYVAKIPDRAAFDLVGEQLDTPAILHDHISKIELETNSLDEHGTAVVLGHHALLPQSIPRIAVYTELINAGHCRFSLSSLNKTIVYCHGHIHQSPIEIVENPSYPSGRLILMSAPLMTEGFNLVRMHFNSNDVALGCEVVPYRMQEHGIVRKNPSVKVPFHRTPSASHLCEGKVLDVLKAVTEKPSRLSEISEKLHRRTKVRPRSSGVESALRELEWFGLVDVQNAGLESKYWHVRRVGA